MTVFVEDPCYYKPMTYIYHAVPETMVGDQLIPLNQMQSSMPDIYENNLDKYQGRKKILERNIFLLDCLWNDVTHFLPVHPQKVFELQKSLGLIDVVPAYRYYEIDVSKLDATQTVVFFKTAPGEANTDTKWLSEVDLSLLQEVPEATLEYYKSLIGKDESLFNYQFIPHILCIGKVDISKAKIITLKAIV